MEGRKEARREIGKKGRREEMGGGKERGKRRRRMEACVRNELEYGMGKKKRREEI